MSDHAEAAKNLSEGITLRYIEKLEAENQRLREALERIEETAGHDSSEPQRCALCIAREALAGDTDG